MAQVPGYRWQRIYWLSFGRKLLGEGHGVRVLDNLSSGKRANLSDVAGDIDFHEADLRDEDAVQRAVKGVEYILHHAAVAPADVRRRAA